MKTHSSSPLFSSPCHRLLRLLGVAALSLANIAPIHAAAPDATPITAATPIDPHHGLVFFAGRWLSPPEAARLEEVRYRKQRVAAPIEVAVDLTAEQMQALTGRRDLAEALMAVLRIGDRLVIHHANQQWPIWKRHSKPTESFRAAITALRKGKSAAENWAPDLVTSIKADTAGPDLLAAVAFTLHTARNAYPHADLLAEQLPAQGASIKRNNEDGHLTLLVLGGEQVKTLSGNLAKFGTLAFLQVPPGADPVILEWTTPPQRLLVVADQPVKFLPLQQDVVLRKHEKQVIHFSHNKAVVTAIRRYSQGPDYPGWQQQTLAASGPLGFQMELSRDEIGPQAVAGEYRRIWIVDLGSQEAVTQRQMGMRYRVKDDEKEAQSREFFRR